MRVDVHGSPLAATGDTSRRDARRPAVIAADLDEEIAADGGCGDGKRERPLVVRQPGLDRPRVEAPPSLDGVRRHCPMTP
jgi:hypothetical protein